MIVRFPKTRYRFIHWGGTNAADAGIRLVEASRTRNSRGWHRQFERGLGVWLAVLAICTSASTSVGQTQTAAPVPTSASVAASPTTSAPRLAPSPMAEQEVGGHAIMQALTRQMARHATVQSKLRVRTNLLGDPLIGSGTYVQWKSSKGILLRMELAIQAGQQTTSVKQISNGRTLWEHWRVGESVRVNRIDLKKVYEALQRNPNPIPMTSGNLATGGLPRLANQLEASFNFDAYPVRTGEIGKEKLPVWTITGAWKPPVLAAKAPKAISDGKVVFENLPAHLPHEVELIVDRRSLFPYRVTFKKWISKDGKSTRTPVVTTQFFEVTLDHGVDPALFQYEEPTDTHVADRTDVFIESLGIGLAANPRAAATR